MGWVDLAIALGIGLMAAFVSGQVARKTSQTGSVTERIARLGRMRAETLDAATEEETFVVTKTMIEVALRDHTRPAKFAWASNFVWFVAGAGVSLFTSEIRALAGLG